MKWVIWNADRAKPVGQHRFNMRTAMRYAGLLETMFGNHYTVVRA